MLTEERQQKIIDIINRDGTVYSKNLIEMFGFSRETIRRDLNDLEERGILKKVYGGATLNVSNHQNTLAPYENRIKENLKDKEEIAEIVCAMVSDGMAIAVDSSTTNLVICRALNKRFRNLYIITNSVPIANELDETMGNRIVLLGGNFNKTERCTVGQNTLDQLKGYHADLYLMSCCGVTVKGITDIGEAELQVKRGMMEASETIYLVCSHKRFGMTTLCRVCDTKAVRCIITDHGLSDEQFSKYQKAGIRVVRGSEDAN